MDTFTHLLLGHAMGIAASSLGTTAPGAVYWALVIGNSLPDIDVPVSLVAKRNLKWHRTGTHTLAGAAGLSLGASLILSRVIPGADLVWVFFWTLLGAWTHVAGDALNLFGVNLLGPAAKPTAAGILHITDPVLLAALLGCSLASSLLWDQPWLTVGGLLFSASYVGWRFIRACQIRRALRQRGALRADLIPWFAGWRYVAETADSIEYGRWQFDRPAVLATYPKPGSALLKQLGRHSEVKTFLASARYPYAIIESDEVIWGCALHQTRLDYRPLRLKLPCTES